MGNRPCTGGGDQPRKIRSALVARLGQRVGTIPLTGRYFRLPHELTDDYAITDVILGSGFNGQVRLGVSKSTGNPDDEGSCAPQKVAIKGFHLSDVRVDLRKELESEVEVVLCMDHPHVIRLYGCYEDSVKLNLVMEVCEEELFQRLQRKKKFSESDAAEAMHQMLLGVNYCHSHGIVHRDIKLENFMYEKSESNHLKLIDFGFGKVWDPSENMRTTCGSLDYLAPEVIGMDYTSQCDTWSMGVISFILLSGTMPFYGKNTKQNIMSGAYEMKPAKWDHISDGAKDFVRKLIVVDPSKRLTASQALEHQWLRSRQQAAEGTDSQVDDDVASALRDFAKTSKFRRAALQMMAWSLTGEERAQVQKYFLMMDKNKQGTITLGELRELLQTKFSSVSDSEINNVFSAMDSNQNEEIHYSDFLAAMVQRRIALHEDLLRQSFNKFDHDQSGYITADNLKAVLGKSMGTAEAAALIEEADVLKDGVISYAEFVSYMMGTPLPQHLEAAGSIVDEEVRQREKNDPLFLRAPGWKARNSLKLKKEAATKILHADSRVMYRQETCCCGFGAGRRQRPSPKGR